MLEWTYDLGSDTMLEYTRDHETTQNTETVARELLVLYWRCISLYNTVLPKLEDLITDLIA